MREIGRQLVFVFQAPLVLYWKHFLSCWDGKTYANGDGDGGTLSDPTPGLSEHYHSHSPSVSLPQCEPPRALSTDFLVNRESENSVSFSFEGQSVGATAYKRVTDDDRGGICEVSLAN